MLQYLLELHLSYFYYCNSSYMFLRVFSYYLYSFVSPSSTNKGHQGSSKSAGLRKLVNVLIVFFNIRFVSITFFLFLYKKTILLMWRKLQEESQFQGNYKRLFHRAIRSLSYNYKKGRQLIPSENQRGSVFTKQGPYNHDLSQKTRFVYE